MRGIQLRLLSLIVVFALAAGLLPATAIAAEAAEEAVEESWTVSVEAPMTLGADSWSWGPSTACSASGGAEGFCTFSVTGGSYGGPAGVGGGCLAERQGQGGGGSLVVFPAGQPSVAVTLHDLGWQEAHGRHAEVALLSGRWTADGREGLVRGMLVAAPLSADNCGLYASGAVPRAVLQLVPSTVPVPEENTAPDMPALIAPPAEHLFQWTDEKRLVMSASDPQDDPYYGEIEVTKSPGLWPGHTFTVATGPAFSGQEASAVLPVAVQGAYSWRARACDPGGSGECSAWSGSRAFAVEHSPVEDAAREPIAEAERTRWLRLTAGVQFGPDSWTLSSEPGCQYRDGLGNSGLCSLTASGGYGPEAGVGPGCFAQRQARAGTGTLTLHPDAGGSFELSLDEVDWRAADGVPGGETAVLSARWRLSDREGRISGVLVAASGDSDCASYAGAGKPQAALLAMPSTIPAPDGNRPPDVPVLISPEDGHRFAWDAEKRFVIGTSDADEDPYHGQVEITRTDPVEIGEQEPELPTVTVFTSPAALGSAAAIDVPALSAGAYSWRARACDPSGSGECSDWSGTRAFTVDPSPAEETADEVAFEIAQTRTVQLQGRMAFGQDTWTWVSDTCGYSDGGGIDDNCALSAAGSYGPAAGVGGGCLAQRQGRDGEGSLRIDRLGQPSVTVELDLMEWRVATGRTGGETAVFSGRWVRGKREGRVSGLIVNASLTADCTAYGGPNAMPRAVLQFFPSAVPAPEGNQPPARPTLVSPADGRSFAWDDDKRMEIRATDANGDLYQAEVEVRSLQRPLTLLLPGTPAASGGHSFTYSPLLESGQYQWRARACDTAGSGDCSEWTHEWAEAPGFTVQRSVMEDGLASGEEDVAQSRTVRLRAPITFGSSSWSWGPAISCGATGTRAGNCTFSASGGYGDSAGVGPGCFATKTGTAGTATLTVHPEGRPAVVLTLSDFGWQVAEGRGGSEVAVLSGRWSDGERHGRVEGLAATTHASTDCAIYADAGAPEMVLDLLPDDLVVGGGTQAPPTTPLQVSPDTDQVWWASDRQVFRINATDPNRDFYMGSIEVRPLAEDGTPGDALPAFSTSPNRSGLQSEGAPLQPLGPGRWEWRARATDPAGSNQWGAWSGWRAFTIGDTSDLPAMIVPTSDGAGLEPFYPYRSWPLGGPVTAYANLANGNLVVQGEGVSVPGPLNLRVTYTYNAIRDQIDGPIGRGWTLGVQDFDSGETSVVAALLALDLTGALTIVGTDDRFEFVDADGTRHRFLKGGLSGPGWHGPPGIDLTVVEGVDTLGNRWYRLVRPDGVRYEFTLVGDAHRLTRIADRKGNELVLSYTGERLTSLTDGSGRSVTFLWSGARVTTVRYSAAGSTFDVGFAVNGVGRLASVTRAAGTAAAQTIAFGYGADGLSGVTDPRGSTTSFAFAAGRLTTLTDRAGEPWSIVEGDACAPGRDTGITPVCVIDPPEGTEEHATIYQISAQGNMVEERDAGEVDELGQTRRNRKTYVWSDNRVQRMTDEIGTVTDYRYNELGQVTRKTVTPVTDPTFVTEIDYVSPEVGVSDMVEARVGVGSGDQRTWRFEYDEEGRGLLIAQTDPTGARTEFSHYPNRGYLKTVRDPRGSTTTVGDPGLADGGYHHSGQPTKITDPTGAVVSFSYDFMGRLTQRLDRLGKVWNTTYDARGNVLSQSNPANSATALARHCYDANDNVVLTIKSKASSASCAQTGTEAHVSRTDYDARDLVAVTTTSSGTQIRRTKNRYAPDGMLAETRFPRSFDSATGQDLSDPAQIQKVSYQYYANNRVKTVTDPEGGRSDVVYTPSGRPRVVWEPRHHQTDDAQRRMTTFAYNWRGQATSSLVSGHPAATTSEYSVHGELVRRATPAGRITQYEYDRMGRLKRTVDPHGRSSQRTYDAAGNLTSITQPVGSGGTLTTAYTYTARNEIASETDPADAKHLIRYTYDAEGRQTNREDVNNGVVTRSIQQAFRADGLPVERTSAYTGTTAGQHRSTFAYDAHGNMTSTATYLDGAGTPNLSDISVTYTSADEVSTWTESITPLSGAAVTKASSFSYAPDGALASRTVDGQTTTYTHWRNGLEKSTTPWGGAAALTSTWMPNAALASTSGPGGLSSAYTYDGAARVNSKRVARNSSTVASWQQVVYDGDDNRTGERVTIGRPGGGTFSGTGTYGYDQVGRLIQARHPLDGKLYTYVVDDAGNVVNDGEASYGYTYNRLTSARSLQSGSLGQNIRFGYDQQGNMTEQCCESTVEHDSLWETTTTTTSRTSFSYDGGSQTNRVRRQTRVTVEHPLMETPFVMNFDDTVRYAHDSLGRMVRRSHSDSESSTPDVVELVFHDRSSAEVVLETNGAGTVATRYVLDSRGMPLGQHTSAGFGWYVTDLRLNVTQVLDSTGIVKSTYAYDPFGEGKDNVTQSSSGFDSKLRFQMARHDPVVGMYSVGPRLLDPGINRFVGADFYVAAAANMELALDPLTGNRYLYAGANPAGFVDNGHHPERREQWYTYTHEYRLPDVRMSASWAASVIKSDPANFFAFPIDCGGPIRHKATCALRPLLFWTNHVRVVGDWGTGWMFRAGKGHIEGEGSTISFRFRNDDNGGLIFTVHAHGPQSGFAPWDAGGAAFRHVVSFLLWQHMAVRLAEYYKVCCR